MKTYTITNPTSGGGDAEADSARGRARAALAALSSAGIAEHFETEGAGDAARLARDVAQRVRDESSDGERATLLLAGGDGTLHDALQGLVDAPWDRMAVAVIPLGTGNDFARTLGLSVADAADWLEAYGRSPHDAFSGWECVAIDLLELELSDGTTRYALNAVTGGASAAVAELMNDAQRQTWGALAYPVAAFTAAKEMAAADAPDDPDALRWSVSVDREDGPRELADVSGIVVANGATAGGGWRVAPHADPTDGVLDVLLYLAPSSTLELPGWVVRLMAGDVTRHDRVVPLHSRALRIEAQGPRALPLRADGEAIPSAPIGIRCVPQGARLWRQSDERSTP